MSQLEGPRQRLTVLNQEPKGRVPSIERAMTSGRRDNLRELFAMVGYVEMRILRRYLHFLLRGLTHSQDAEVQKIKAELLPILAHDFFRLPEHTPGFLFNSGSETNMMALAIAALQTQRETVLATNLSHSSIANSCKLLRLKLITVDANPERGFQAVPEHVEALIKSHQSDIACIVSTAGVTHLGINEHFHRYSYVRELCREHGIRIHLDAAYGGMIKNLLAERQSEFRPEAEGVDSITVDPYKLVGPLGCAAMLVPGRLLKEKEAEYFPSTDSFFGTTRSPFPPIVALEHLKTLGWKGLIGIAEWSLLRAQETAQRLQDAGFTILAPIESGIIPIKLDSAEEVERYMTTLKEKGLLISRIQIESQSGRYPTTYGIRIVARPNPEITPDVLDRFVETCIQLKNKK